jgi:hypothetical protein
MALKRDEWIYGELLRKRWGINERTLEAIACDELPAYDRNGETLDSADGMDHIDRYRFRVEDVEKFEQEHPELLKAAIGKAAS